ncbi:unnamed protein product [Prorocentrum cordatum]|uniref:Uncharacterized protein n=1 Tax=Prorocentrum cordatum TaxID=2364126 RepID=A0ABN9T8B8_9DINO|nr:unnamed protein product [Polarella glacialis]
MDNFALVISNVKGCSTMGNAVMVERGHPLVAPAQRPRRRRLRTATPSRSMVEFLGASVKLLRDGAQLYANGRTNLTMMFNVLMCYSAGPALLVTRQPLCDKLGSNGCARMRTGAGEIFAAIEAVRPRPLVLVPRTALCELWRTFWAMASEFSQKQLAVEWVHSHPSLRQQVNVGSGIPAFLRDSLVNQMGHKLVAVNQRDDLSDMKCKATGEACCGDGDRNGCKFANDDSTPMGQADSCDNGHSREYAAQRARERKELHDAVGSDGHATAELDDLDDLDLRLDGLRLFSTIDDWKVEFEVTPGERRLKSMMDMMFGSASSTFKKYAQADAFWEKIRKVGKKFNLDLPPFSQVIDSVDMETLMRCVMSTSVAPTPSHMQQCGMEFVTAAQQVMDVCFGKNGLNKVESRIDQKLR